ncbi:tRNA dimethylallyltransferase [Candidatus Saccharibacteria bacterium]|nr:tRNA dimethylallyltransferase [Candidatus Saccharibacteria bacterium]
MENVNSDLLLVILGQTASGKSQRAIQIAKQFNGEIICADSRTVYQGLDIGTAKPTQQDRIQVRHHLLDIIKPSQDFNVSDFKRLADEAIADILRRGKLPILVGGSGLYIDAVIYNYQFRDYNQQEIDQEMTTAQMQRLIRDMGLELPTNSNNPRHLLGILKSGANAPNNRELRDNTLLVGLAPPEDVLLQRIEKRTRNMVEDGLIEELKSVVAEFGWQPNALQAPAYISFKGYLDGSLNLEDCINKCIIADKRLAKKQATWFKRNKSIHWLNYPSKYVESTIKLLNNYIRND